MVPRLTHGYLCMRVTCGITRGWRVPVPEYPLGTGDGLRKNDGYPYSRVFTRVAPYSYLLPLQPVQRKTSSAGIEDSNLSTEGSVSLHVSPSSLTSLSTLTLLSALTSPFEHDTEVSAPNTSPALSCPDATPLLESPCIPPNVQRVRSIAQPKVQPTQSLPLRGSKRLKSEHTSSPLDLLPTPSSDDFPDPVGNIPCY